MNPNDKTKYICIDFDGVINPYTKGFQGKGVFEDPEPECKTALEELKLAGWTIIIHTCRVEALDIVDYLKKFGIPWDEMNDNPANREHNLSFIKPYAHVYLDDRAVNFGGSWKGILSKITSFKRWGHIDQGGRPTLPLEICGYKVDQVALFVPSVINSVQTYRDFGYKAWVMDDVRAHDRMTGNNFEVRLAFNYEMMPVEFELLELIEGITVQLPGGIDQGLSHYGFHVPDMGEAEQRFSDAGFKKVSDVETTWHSGCPYRYNYVFFDTQLLGFFTKLIARIS